MYECLRTIAAIWPNPGLVTSALESMARFLSARENNLRYAGIDALARLVRVDARHAADHQVRTQRLGRALGPARELLGGERVRVRAQCVRPPAPAVRCGGLPALAG